MSREPLRIAGASGFWGDRNDALLDQVRGGPVDFVLLDYLAEITMSILRVKKLRDPNGGYAGDFLKALAPALPDAVARSVRIVTNAGGMNPRACAEAVVALARQQGHGGLRVGLVEGDDIADQLGALADRGVPIANMDTGAAFSTIRERVLSANVYFGADPIAEALRQGAQIVVTGRCTDSALALGPLLFHYGWGANDWNRRAAGVVAGHVIECGGQASGGNFAGGWESVPDLANLGYPIAEVEASGDFVVTKHPGFGGLVTPAVVKEQLLYEIGDPRAYLTPDASVDFTSLRLTDEGKDRVRIADVRGGPPPEQSKVSIAYQDGFTNAVGMTFVWPHARERAKATEQLLLERCAKRGIQIDAHHVDWIGVDGSHGPMAPAPREEPNELLFRMAIRTRDRESAKRFGEEIAPLMLSGLPGAGSGLLTGRPDPRPIVNFWPALVPRDAATPRVEVLTA
jgi:Acyclic terpene utilisation family protein AtuA